MKFPRLVIFVVLSMLLACIVPASSAEDQTTQNRLSALIEAVKILGQPDDHSEYAAAEMCWTPDTEFSPVGIASEVPFGVRSLVARYIYGSVTREKPVKAVWRYNNSEESLSTGDCKMVPGISYIINGIKKPDAPLFPGIYEVTFTADGKTIANGKIKILPAVALGQRNANDVYKQGLTALRDALAEVDASRAQPAAQAASKALPLLGTVINANQNNADAKAAFELAQSIVGIGKMESLAQKKDAVKVLDWAKRSLAHARISLNTASDSNLKTAARHFMQTLEQAIPDIEKAAGNAGK